MFGIGSSISYAAAAEWILRALPRTEKIVVVHGAGKADQAFAAPIDALKERIEARRATWSAREPGFGIRANAIIGAAPGSQSCNVDAGTASTRGTRSRCLAAGRDQRLDRALIERIQGRRRITVETGVNAQPAQVIGDCHIVARQRRGGGGRGQQQRQ